PRLDGVPAVEPGQALEHPEHGLLGGLVGVVGVAEDPLADVAGQARVAPVELDEGLGVSSLEVEHEHAVVQVHVGPAALGGGVSHVGNADDHSYPANETSGKGLGFFAPLGLVGASLRTSAATGSTLAWRAGPGSEAH